MISLIDYEAALHLWGIDKFDFIICISAYVGVVFGSVETGLVIAVFDTKNWDMSSCLQSWPNLTPTNHWISRIGIGSNIPASRTIVRSKAKDLCHGQCS